MTIILQITPQPLYSNALIMFRANQKELFLLKNLGSLQILRDTLKLKEFRIVGKRGASAADFDYNDFRLWMSSDMEMNPLPNLTDLNRSNWEVIGEVKAAGTSKYIRGYQYSDSDRIFAELIFYRLKMIDHDGSLTYSEIRSIAGELVGERLVYPNPATDHLKFDLAPEQLVELKIFNVARIEHPVRTQVGDQGSILDVSQLREGIYILRVTTKSKAIHMLRFIIRR